MLKVSFLTLILLDNGEVFCFKVSKFYRAKVALSFSKVPLYHFNCSLYRTDVFLHPPKNYTSKNRCCLVKIAIFYNSKIIPNRLILFVHRTKDVFFYTSVALDLIFKTASSKQLLLIPTLKKSNSPYHLTNTSR